MKVYIGSSSKFIRACEEIAHELEIRGFTITRKWWNWFLKDYPEFRNMSPKEYYEHPQVKFIRWRDEKAIDDADIVIIYNEDLGGEPYRLQGAIYEAGYAAKAGKQLIFVGSFEVSTMFQRATFVKDIPDLLELLKRGFDFPPREQVVAQMRPEDLNTGTTIPKP